MVWAVPGSCSVMDWARRMFMRWGGVVLWGKGGLPTFHMGNYFLLKGYLLFLFLDLNLSFKKGRYTVYDPALCLGDLRSNFLLYNF